MQFHFKYQYFFNRDTRDQEGKSSWMEMHVIVCAQGQKIDHGWRETTHLTFEIKNPPSDQMTRQQDKNFVLLTTKLMEGGKEFYPMIKQWKPMAAMNSNVKKTHYINI